MKKTGRDLARLMLPSLVVTVVLLGVDMYAGGYRLNITPSLPLGVYQLTGADPKLGDTVLFCLESAPFVRVSQERGYLGGSRWGSPCPGGLLPLGKQLYALPGDNIGIKADGSISINGRVIAGSAARRRDSRGRPIPAPLLQAGIVPPGRALALALRNPGSFDGRYFGLTSLVGMQVVRPVWIFE